MISNVKIINVKKSYLLIGHTPFQGLENLPPTVYGNSTNKKYISLAKCKQAFGYIFYAFDTSLFKSFRHKLSVRLTHQYMLVVFS